MSLMSYAHDTDLYAAWARLAVDGTFAAPSRDFACGGAYLRAQGSGRSIVAVHGLDRVSPTTRSCVVEARLPAPDASPTGTYDGDGHVIVRHPETAVVEGALAELVTTITVTTR